MHLQRLGIKPQVLVQICVFVENTKTHGDVTRDVTRDVAIPVEIFLYSIL